MVQAVDEERGIDGSVGEGQAFRVGLAQDRGRGRTARLGEGFGIRIDACDAGPPRPQPISTIRRCSSGARIALITLSVSSTGRLIISAV